MNFKAIFVDNFFEWGLVVAGLIFLVHVAKVIDKEKEDYLARAKPHVFKNFKLLIPSWWTIKDQKEGFIEYHRADTYYDWRAKFIWIPFSKQLDSTDLKDYFANLIIQREIQFDAHESIIKEGPDFLEHPLLENNETEFIRVEGTATEKMEHRIYYDALLVKDSDQKGYLFCESRSSILNGMLEGPYFEEVLQRIEKNKELS